MEREDARRVVLQHLDAKETKRGEQLVLVDEVTMERPFGWVFFYQSKRYLESGEIRDALAGNAPLVVTRSDGRVHPTGTAYPIEVYLKQFENYVPQ